MELHKLSSGIGKMISNQINDFSRTSFLDDALSRVCMCLHQLDVMKVDENLEIVRPR